MSFFCWESWHADDTDLSGLTLSFVSRRFEKIQADMRRFMNDNYDKKINLNPL